MSRWPAFAEAARATASALPVMHAGVQRWSFLALAIVLAPLTEELIFRGLIYRGLRLSLSIDQSAAVAAVIFALAHPGLAFLPVCGMAFCAARAFERSKSLLSATLVHAIYNGTLVLCSAMLG
jgi:membrane protease YdiL (CAAX protease family)